MWKCYRDIINCGGAQASIPDDDLGSDSGCGSIFKYGHKSKKNGLKLIENKRVYIGGASSNKTLNFREISS